MKRIRKKRKEYFVRTYFIQGGTDVKFISKHCFKKGGAALMTITPFNSVTIAMITTITFE